MPRIIIRIFGIVLLTFLASISVSGQSFSLKIVPMFGEELLTAEETYQLKGQPVRIHQLRFYLSDLQFLHKGKVLAVSTERFHLFDLSDTTTFVWEMGALPRKKFDAIRFNLGIDSLTQVSGAMGGVLDPTLGMFWTWQSGYIHVKIEGSSPLCTTRKNRFQFHLGGYLSPFNTLQTMEFEVKSRTFPKLVVDLKAFLDEVDLRSTQEIMSPGEPAVRLSKQMTKAFTIKQ